MPEQDHEVRAWAARRGWMQRVIILDGAVQAVLDYDGLPLAIIGERDRLLVDGALINPLDGTGPSTDYRTFVFPLRIADASVDCTLELYVTSQGLYRIRDVTLRVGERLVYSEESGRVRRGGRSDLPIPVQPGLSPEALPLPGRLKGKE
jgi:hypothetical protein